MPDEVTGIMIDNEYLPLSAVVNIDGNAILVDDEQASDKPYQNWNGKLVNSTLTAQTNHTPTKLDEADSLLRDSASIIKQLEHGWLQHSGGASMRRRISKFLKEVLNGQ